MSVCNSFINNGIDKGDSCLQKTRLDPRHKHSPVIPVTDLGLRHRLASHKESVCSLQ